MELQNSLKKYLSCFLLFLIPLPFVNSQDNRILSITMEVGPVFHSGQEIADPFLKMPALYSNYGKALQFRTSIILHTKRWYPEPVIFASKSGLHNWKSPTDWNLYREANTSISSLGLRAEIPWIISLGKSHSLRLSIGPSFTINKVKTELYVPLNEFFPNYVNPEPFSGNVLACPGLGAETSIEFNISEIFWLHFSAGYEHLYINSIIFPDTGMGRAYYSAGINMALARNKIIY